MTARPNSLFDSQGEFHRVFGPYRVEIVTIDYLFDEPIKRVVSFQNEESSLSINIDLKKIQYNGLETAGLHMNENHYIFITNPSIPYTIDITHITGGEDTVQLQISSNHMGFSTERYHDEEVKQALLSLKDALIEEAERQTTARAQGRNLTAFQQTVGKQIGNTKLSNVGNLISGFLTGKSGTATEKITALKKNAGSPNARRRKTRRNRK